MGRAKWIYRRYPEKWRGLEEFKQQEEFVKDINDNITRTVNNAVKELNRKPPPDADITIEQIISMKRVPIGTCAPAKQHPVRDLILGTFICIIFPPALIWVLYTSIKSYNQRKRGTADHTMNNS